MKHSVFKATVILCLSAGIYDSVAQEAGQRQDRRRGNPPPSELQVNQQLRSIIADRSLTAIDVNAQAVLPVEDPKVQLGKKLFLVKYLAENKVSPVSVVITQHLAVVIICHYLSVWHQWTNLTKLQKTYLDLAVLTD